MVLLKIVLVRQVFFNSIFIAPRQASNENVWAQARRAFPKIEVQLGRAHAMLCSLGHGGIGQRVKTDGQTDRNPQFHQFIGCTVHCCSGSLLSGIILTHSSRMLGCLH